MDLVSVVLGIIGFLLQVVLVPAILLGLLALGIQLATSPSAQPLDRIRKFMAVWLGFSVFILIMMLHVFKLLAPNGDSLMNNNVILFIGLGLIIGPGLLALLDSLLRTTAVPMFVAILIATSLTTLYFYAFVDIYRIPIVMTTISMLVGSLAYVVLFPKIVQDLGIDLKLDV
jgi:hypothetical protein